MPEQPSLFTHNVSHERTTLKTKPSSLVSVLMLPPERSPGSASLTHRSQNVIILGNVIIYPLCQVESKVQGFRSTFFVYPPNGANGFKSSKNWTKVWVLGSNIVVSHFAPRQCLKNAFTLRKISSNVPAGF